MTASLRIAFAARAAREVERIDDWSRANRPAVPDLFFSELTTLLAVVAVEPRMGTPARAARLAGVRRLLLPRSRHHVYYRVASEGVVVLAIWHTSRSGEPAL